MKFRDIFALHDFSIMEREFSNIDGFLTWRERERVLFI